MRYEQRGADRSSAARISNPDRRRIGIGLLTFGIAGLVILVAAAMFILASLGSLGPFGGDVASQVRRVDATLEATSATLEATRAATGNLTGSVAGGATSARGAAALAAQLAATMHDLSLAMGVSFFGSRPFAGLGSEFDQVSARSNELAGEMTALARSLDANAADTSGLATQVDRLRTSVEDLRAAIGPGSPISGAATALSIARGLLLAIVAWLTVPALVAALFGARIVRNTPGDLVEASNAAPSPAAAPPIKESASKWQPRR